MKTEALPPGLDQWTICKLFQLYTQVEKSESTDGELASLFHLIVTTAIAIKPQVGMRKKR